jgi:D-alanyl-lipoteichoic acid acyltransferase DltB (MBOAT superfamily)
MRLILPIGLSFHTFQAMSYTIEVYRENQEPERNFGIYALYVMFYPQLVAGPIERPQNLLHQFREEHVFDYERVTSGLRQMGWGFFKKLVIADRVGVGADAVFGNVHGFSGPGLALGTVMFVVQVYADFSGYSDIALGSARVMGFELMKNFDRPYGSRNPAEFWRRWHISLYSWMNDYVYTPIVLGLRDWGRWAVYIGIVVTLTLSGLWHGAAWTFIVFGFIHSVALLSEVVTRGWRKRMLRGKAWGVVGIASMFCFLCFVDIFFRSSTLREALYVVRHIIGDGSAETALLRQPGRVWELLASMGLARGDATIAAIAVTGMFGLEALHARYDLVSRLLAQPTALRWSAYYALVLGVIFLGAQNANPRFIYFQF